jgi:8-oxo-dGTP pyrophosphatase MutT (NUDIX family)
VLDPDDRVLLFHFVHTHGPLAGRVYWATPGGALEGGETYAEAARRELFEETGIVVDTIGAHVAEREFVLQWSDGENVVAQERFFLVRTADHALSRACWTPEEIEVMADHRWWSIKGLTTTSDVVYPADLAEILARMGVRTGE